ncbi:uncharacterized protein LOC131949071 [Physella acuta]|uniref:uncharacterized protein LOC131949071 n=1 Tax=Physella acuta TaxID=109671 RepID=UPI0027DE6309|nr:uncharacterized protein LOC131949071 [Physella acuta]
METTEGGKIFFSMDYPIGAIVVPCESEFTFQCDLQKTNFPFIDSLNHFEFLKAVEFIVFSRHRLLTSDSPKINDELIIATNYGFPTTVTVNSQTYFSLHGNQRETIVISDTRPMHVRANNLIDCYYLIKGNDCTSSMALAWLIPVELFYFSYVFSVPFPYNSTTRHMGSYLIMIADKDTYSTILLDDKNALNYRALVSDVNHTPYQVRYLRIPPGWHSAYSTNLSNFGLYVFGWKDKGAYLHVVGYAYGNNVRATNREIAVDGGWGQWGLTECDGCNDTYSTRMRLCENLAPKHEGMNCVGHDKESFNTLCHTCDINSCPVGLYGSNCNQQCGYCVGDGACDVRSGNCELCSNGWIGDKCWTSCPKWTYGHHCKYSCKEKCNGQDCIEREQGMCPSVYEVATSALVYYVLLFLLVGSICVVYLYRKSGGKQPKRADVVITVKRVSSKEYTVTKRVNTDV